MRFMVSLTLEVPPERQAEAPALRAAEDAHVTGQIQRGALEGLYIEAAPAGPPSVWAILRADSLEEAQRQVAEYPLFPFFTQLRYTPLR